MTWMEWMNMRTDEDIQREEQAEAEALASFHLYSGDYYEEDEAAEAANGTGDSSPAWVPAPGAGTTGTVGNSSASRVHADASGHNFKSADAHAPPALHHNSHHLSPESPTSPSVTRHAHSHVHSAHSAHSGHHHSPRQEDGHAGSEGAARAVSLEELSVPSCSDEDEEYDFDDF
jgi:ABC-type nickel/cobalt efflux system permease component RcnA